MNSLIGLGDAWYPITSIEKITSHWKPAIGAPPHSVRVSGREVSFGIHDGELEQLLTTPIQLIPAQSGTYILWAWLEDDIVGVGKAPVIGWALCLDGVSRPVTAQGVNDGTATRDATVYIEMPDGSVQAGNTYEEPPFYADLASYREGQVERLKAAAAVRLVVSAARAAEVSA